MATETTQRLSGDDLLEAMNEILSSESLEEAEAAAQGQEGGGKNTKRKHWPFKTRKKLGPGPKKRKNFRKDHWRCRKAGPYKQKCKGAEGEKKTVVIDKQYKAKYNKLYRKWRKKKAK